MRHDDDHVLVIIKPHGAEHVERLVDFRGHSALFEPAADERRPPFLVMTRSGNDAERFDQRDDLRLHTLNIPDKLFAQFRHFHVSPCMSFKRSCLWNNCKQIFAISAMNPAC